MDARLLIVDPMFMLPERMVHLKPPFYSERTLTRACLADSGQSAKCLIDARVLLEAKRLLAYGNESVDSISRRLGFSDSSSTGRFFKRLQGGTPMGFRLAVRAQVG